MSSTMRIVRKKLNMLHNVMSPLNILSLLTVLGKNIGKVRKATGDAFCYTCTNSTLTELAS